MRRPSYRPLSPGPTASGGRRRRALGPRLVAGALAVGGLAGGWGCEAKTKDPNPAAQVPKPPTEDTSAGGPMTLQRARAGFVTQVKLAAPEPVPPPIPPADELELVRYPAPHGANAAYVTPARSASKGLPAMIWIAGGVDFSIGAQAWKAAPRHDDRSGRAFSRDGMVLMQPSLRGAGDNPGQPECFFGEVDDVLAAAEYLAKRPDVDARRIYLGGHGTGGTLALLAAVSSERFRAVFAFGPVADPAAYGEAGCLPLDVSEQEHRLRTPVLYVRELRTPTFIFEGEKTKNVESARLLFAKSGKAPIEVLIVPGANHVDLVAPLSELIAEKVLQDTGAEPQLGINMGSVNLRMFRERSR